MSAERTRSWKVGEYRATMTLKRSRTGELGVVITWEPSVPSKLTKEEIKQYRDGRDAAIRDLGLSVLVVEL